MKICGLWVVHVLTLAFFAWGDDNIQQTRNDRGTFYYGTFPSSFSWGVGSSAYQIEGAWDSDGKGESIWDVFTHRKGKVFMNQTGDSTCDGYNKVKEDFELLKELKVSHYRFSLSWPRIIPTGIQAEGINEKGIKYYNDLINILLQNKITPLVTLYHWDLPQSVAVHGYETGKHAPGMKLMGTGAYKAAHHMIKAHAQVWHSYNKNWRIKQQGMVGISLTTEWGEPVDISNQKDIEAADRFIQFHLGWFANTLYNGDYPQIMKELIGQKSAHQGLRVSRLPTFTSQEKSYIKGTVDFLGIGHFTTRYITSRNYPSTHSPSFYTDRDLTELVDPRWPEPESNWLCSVPWGFRRLLNYVKTHYGNPMVFVTENGASEKMQCVELCDEWRIQYLKGYINEMLKAMKDGANVQGYTAWSLMDMFEWDDGFSERSGLFYVEFQNKNKSRYPKASVPFFKRIIAANGFPNPREVENWQRKSIETCSTMNQLLAAEEQRNTAANILRLIHDPLTTHMEMVTEIVVPTVFTICILISAVLLMILLRRQS
ncbi:lactase-like protein isoform X3 [Xenopus laevis]|uniref:Lactase-like protein isoform X3 n=1 Tax=Xenopus laevis TaxID=8355 RepID=A0A8J1MN41_XENLA|nr:lactase-like protein isoform X3 [Xenopus laevis]